MEIMILVGFVAVAALCMCVWLVSKVGALGAKLEDVSKRSKTGTAATVDISTLGREVMPGLVKWLDETARKEIAVTVQRAFDEKLGGLGNSAAISDKVAQLLVNEVSQYSRDPFASRLVEELRTVLAGKIATAEWIALQQATLAPQVTEVLRDQLQGLVSGNIPYEDVREQLAPQIPAMVAAMLESPERKAMIAQQVAEVFERNMQDYVNDALNCCYEDVRSALSQHLVAILSEELAKDGSALRETFLSAAMNALGWQR